MSKHEDFMKIAIESAHEGVTQGHGGPFGACIVKDNQVVAVAHNMVLKNNDPTAHAEVSAIRLAAQNLGHYHLEGCTLYTTCSPCPMCLAASYWAHIDKIYAGVKNEVAGEFGFDDTMIFKEVRCEANERKVHFETGFCEQEVIDVFQLWKTSYEKIY